VTFNLATMLREAAGVHPDKPFCLTDDQVVSFADMDADSARVGAGLVAAGLSRGDRVAVQLPNSPEFVTAYFGILKAGCIVVPLNPQLTSREVEYQIADCGAALLLSGDAPPPEAPAEPGDVAPTNPDDTAVILYTSGTTGRPKGAELSHVQLYMDATIGGELFGVRSDDVSLAVLPFFHVYGLSSVLNVAVRYGGTLVLCPKFEPEAVLDLMERHGVTITAGVPTMYHALLQAGPGERDLSRFRIGSCGGSSMPEAVLTAFEQTFSVVILEGYGLTETSSTATLNPSATDRKLLSIGKPIWGVEAKIVDPAGAALPPGKDQIGEICIRGFNVTKGYYGKPEATAEAIRDGWLHTGDLGYADEDGFLYVVDRIKDLIIRGGYNVYPREVEEILYTHPAIAEAAVIGRPDDRLGEEVVAVVSFRPGTSATDEEIISFCQERLAVYKCPREVRTLAEIPKSPSGKLLKKELRESARHPKDESHA
jgi:long-chain acyl-CoA synthetase